MAEIDRRTFLKGLGATGLALAWGLRPDEAWGKQLANAFGQIPVVVGGEDNRVGHMLRDGHVFEMPTAPARKVDVVVVGAGVAGLTAAYHLKGADVMVLEKEPVPGGHARMGTWKDVSYAEGAAYIGDPSRHVGELIDALKIPLKEIGKPEDALFIAGHSYGDLLGEGWQHMPFSRSARNGFKAMSAELRGYKDPPPLPVEEAHTGHLATDLFSVTHWGKAYGPEVMKFLDMYCRAALGGPADKVGAYWLLDFLCSEAVAKYTMPGGNAAFAKALYQAVGPENVRLQATVIQVKQVGDRVHVSYVQDDEVTTVEAKAVVMACAKHIIRRTVVGLPADQAAAMARMQYEPYLVCNVLVDGPWKREAYDTWAFDAPFTDLTVADWVNQDARRPHAVLTAYCPQKFEDRYKLLDPAHSTQVARAVVGHMDRMHPGTARRVKEVRVFRWGHPMVLSAVGAITKLRPLVTRPFGKVYFAAGDNQLTATIEAAVWEGRKHALMVKQAIARTALLVN